MGNLTSKLKNEARREEQRENWSAAIELYSRALRAGERDGAVDVSLYNRIGDIYLRLDDVDSAVGSYERAIVSYAEQELYTSAIALCNKVLRIQPSRISTFLRLGRLQLETGLVAEARVNYLRYATELLTLEQTDEAHAALEEYVVKTEDLDSALRFGGALVANDRGDEALSLFLRLQARLEELGRDTSTLERPLAAIQGFEADEMPPSREEVSSVEELEAEMAGALEAEMAGAPVETSHPPDADPGNIIDLAAELEAAVGAEAEPEAGEPDVTESQVFPSDITSDTAGVPEGIGVPETQPLGSVDRFETPETELDEAVEPPPSDLPASADLAAPEAPERGADDDGRPRVPAEDVEGLETDPAGWPGRPQVDAEPTEATTVDSELLGREFVRSEGAEPAEPDEGEKVAARDAAASGAEPAEIGTTENAAQGEIGREERPRAAEESVEPIDRGPGAPAPEILVAEAEEREEDFLEPPGGAGVDADLDRDAPERVLREAEPSPGLRGPSPERIERPVRSRRSSRPATLAPPDGPESDVLAPAAQLAVELADEADELADEAVELADEAVEVVVGEALAAPWGSLDPTEEREVSEPTLAAPMEDPAGAGQTLAADAPEVGPAFDDAGVLGEEPGAPKIEAIEATLPGSHVAQAPAVPSLRELDPDESVAGAELEEVDPERAQRDLKAGLALVEAEEFDRALEALERAARSPECFLEAHAAIQTCRAGLDATALRGSVEPETEPVADAGMTDAVELTEVPAPTSPVEAEAGVEVGEEETPAFSEVELGPSSQDPGSWLFSPADRSLDEAPESHVGTDRHRSGAPAEARDVEPTGDSEGPEAGMDVRTPERQAPDETFREWLSAASYEVLERALGELERREELERALCVVERMLELRPREAALHRVRIAHAAELGRDELLPVAYLELGRVLAEAEDLKGARAAYQRVAELDPDRTEIREQLRALERRLESIDPLVDTTVTRREREESEAAGSSVEHGLGAEVPREVASRQPPRVRSDEHERALHDDGEVQVYRGVIQDLEGGKAPGPEDALLTDPGDSEREEAVDFDVILAELKEQLADGSANEPDGSSRTELGGRLMDMGLLDDAIRELQAAVRSPDAPPHAFELLGRAFVEKGQPRVASCLLAESLEQLSGVIDEERLLGVVYQLGIAYQEAEIPSRALECYERIFSVDIDYRDVRERIEACAA